MSAVPRQRVRIESIHYGRPQDNTYLKPGKAESLLLSMPHHRLKNGAWSGGGPFFQVTDEIKHMGKRTFPGYMRIIWRDPTDAVGVIGVPGSLTIPDPKSYASSWSAQEANSFTYAAEGYHRTRPGNPIASLGQFLMELRDLPKIPFLQGGSSYRSVFKQGFSLSRAMHELRYNAKTAFGTYARMLGAGWTPGRFIDAVKQTATRNLSPEKLFPGVGGEYLNLIFGWKPFISDVKKAYHLWHNIDKQMAQIIRDNGKGIRRGATLRPNQTVVNSSSSKDYPYPGANVNGFPGDYVNAGGRTNWSVVTTTSEKVWYAAKYRYYVPDVSSSQWRRRAKLALFGALPTPELVWELIPFSWLIDWGVNVGDVVSNMSTNAVDNLVQLYSFIMRTTTTETIATVNTNWGNFGPIRAGSAYFQSTKLQIVKTRVGGGSPYALNAVNGTGLSTYQGGVLAALGISLTNH